MKVCVTLAAVSVLCFPAVGAESKSKASNTNTELVAFSISRGFFEKPVELQLKFADAAASIRFTTDSSAPTSSNGMEFKQPIPISTTTVVRAAPFKGNTRVSRIVTQTYIFLDQVAHQSAPPAGYPSTWEGTPASYSMDRKVVTDPRYADKLKSAFLSVPTLSLVCDRDDLFGSRKGIYLHTTQRGTNWTRACSVELILTNGSTGFETTAGLRIQGNASREPQKSPKHGLRLLFKQQFGPSKLEYQMFPDSPVKKFDNLILRSDFNASWLHWDPNFRARAQRTRDAWLKDSQRAMGWVAPHNRYLHLYINGMYWGLYDATERPDGSFGSAYFGGKPEDYDVVNEFQIKGGTGDVYNQLRSLRALSNPRQYAKAKELLNLTEFADYMLLNYFGANQDFGEYKNWYFLRSRTPPGPFHFFAWDGEQILYNLNDDSISNPYETPLQLADALRANPEFRLLMADRAQKHLFNDGALTPENNIVRWMKRANEIDTAIIAESARWGSYRRNPAFTRDAEWLTEQKRLVTDYFPKRTKVFLQQLKRAGLFPSVNAPSISVAGGSANNPEVKISSEAGTEIYFSLDGADPRIEGGGVSKSAQRYQNEISAAGAKVILARSIKDRVWSPLSEFALAVKSK